MTAGSAHQGGMNMVFADGAVRFINYDTDTEILNNVGHRNDKASYTLD